ncbi:GTPase HflX [Candidatus Desantisbacteria bacterium]|nr:GTPase HflX [Candidatus Desantisbacteria bacterium]
MRISGKLNNEDTLRSAAGYLHYLNHNLDGAMEKALLVIPYGYKRHDWDLEDIISELEDLVQSAGIDIQEKTICRIKEINAFYYIGKGKAFEIKEKAHDKHVDVVIFNSDLTPGQQRTCEEIIGVKVIDRTQLILDIFAQRAKSNEGKIQVELAQLNYILPRLTGSAKYLSRLAGGIGTRGPGEQKLEIDRRRIKEKISKLKTDLEILKRQRKSLRIQRKRNDLPLLSLVGYTNSGKSSLLNKLTGSEAIVENRLFSTLDALTRRLALPNHQKILLTDTVGFLHNLPHNLIESFKSTLEEAQEADLLLHVVDASSHLLLEKIKDVNKVLKELKLEEKPVLMILNKIDKPGARKNAKKMELEFPDSIMVSALSGYGLNKLKDLLEKKLKYFTKTIEILIPFNQMNILDMISREGEVLEREYIETGVKLKARIPTHLANNLKIVSGV